MNFFKTAIILSILFSISIYGQKAKISGGLAYGTEINTVGIYAGGLYQFSEKIEGAGYFTYFFEKDNLSWYALDFDAHYIFSSKNGLELYGLAGLNVTFWSFKVDVEPYQGFGGYTIPESALESSGSEIGFNIGAGLRKSISEKVDLMGDIKYTIGGAEYLNVKIGVSFGI